MANSTFCEISSARPNWDLPHEVIVLVLNFSFLWYENKEKSLYKPLQMLRALVLTEICWRYLQEVEITDRTYRERFCTRLFILHRIYQN